MAEERITSKTDFDRKVPLSEVLVLRISMNPKLFEAATTGDKSILYELLRPQDYSTGASMGDIEYDAMQEDTSCLFGVTLEGNTALHIAASRGHLEIAREICQREATLLEAPNTRLDTPLHCAARSRDDKMVSLLIQFIRQDRIKARRVLRATNWNDENALHEAVKYDDVRVAEILMEEDAGLASMLNDTGTSPLYLAIEVGSFNAAKALLQSSSWEKASPASYAGPLKQTALHLASVLSRDITERILLHDAALAKDANLLGNIPLHIVAAIGNRDMTGLLLKWDPSTAYQSNAEGHFPIHRAAMKGNIGIVDQILKQCPSTYELLDRNGSNFIHAAFKVGRIDLVRKIISKRPDLRMLLNGKDNDGNTPLHTAVLNGDPRSVYYLLRDKSVLPNMMNSHGFTPLDLAFRSRLGQGMAGRTNVADCILSCLAFTKASHGTPALPQDVFGRMASSSDMGEKKPSGDEDKKKPTGKEGMEMKWPDGRVASFSDMDKNKPSGDGGDQMRWMVEEMERWNDREMKKWRDVPKNSLIATVLIATVTFAAGFTVPGGYIADDHPGRGTAVLAKKYAFNVFLVSDIFAFVFSILATFWYLIGGTSAYDMYTRGRANNFAGWCVRVAICGISTAFAMGIYAMLPPSSRAVSILSCVGALGTPLLADMVTMYNVYSFRRTVGIRQGCRHWIWPTAIHAPVEEILGPLLLPPNFIIGFLLVALAPSAIFFLLPMLWVREY